MVFAHLYLHSDARLFRSHDVYIPTASGASTLSAGDSMLVPPALAGPAKEMPRRSCSSSYFSYLTLRVGESCCHGTRVLTWSGN
jgi:hypothetical protein